MESLNRQRSGIKASLTNFKKCLSTFEGKIDSSGNLSDAELIELESRLNILESESFSKFVEVQEKIEALCQEDNLEKEYSERYEFEDKYFSLTASARKLLNTYRKNESDDSSVKSDDNSMRSSNVLNVSDPLQGVKLPVINLPTFDGTLQNWLEFRDIFESLIHKNDSISNVQRFHYLRASLSHEPAQLIKGIVFSAQNYELAWNLLVERYNNDKMLVQSHIKNIFNIEPIHKESAKNIRNLLDTLNKNMRALAQLQLPTEHWDVPMVYLMSIKLDSVTAREWETYKSRHKDSLSLNDFIKFLSSRVEILETLDHNRIDKTFDKRNFTKRSETRSFVVTDNNNQKVYFAMESTTFNHVQIF
nr:unnamed protein product [Callosobruchus chinensis]